MGPSMGAAPDAGASRATGVGRLVSSLRYRDWRYLWSGLMFLQLGEWMDHTALNWFVLVATNSPLALGTMNLVRGVPNLLLAAVGGVVADRVDRRTLMIWTQVAGLLCTATLAVLATANVLEVWEIYLLLVARGVTVAFNHPARSSVIGDLVPREDMMNAMALHSATFNATRMFGPAVAGLMIASVGTAPVLWVNVACFVANIWTLVNMSPGAGTTTRSRGSPLKTLAEGFVYIWQQPVILLLMVLGTVPFVLGQPYQSMLPVFARDVLEIGPQGLGLLLTASATGSLLGAFGVAGLGNLSRKGLVMMGGLIGFGVLLVSFSMTPLPLLAGALLFLAGAAFQVYSTTNASLVQVVVPSEYRGRVLGVYQMDRGLIPVGSFMAGAIAEQAGAPFSVAVMAASLAIIGLGVLAFSPRIRALE